MCTLLYFIASCVIGSCVSHPYDIAVSPDGLTVYICDYGNSRIRKVTGGVVSTFAGPSGTAVLCTLLYFIASCVIGSCVSSPVHSSSTLWLNAIWYGGFHTPGRLRDLPHATKESNPTRSSRPSFKQRNINSFKRMRSLVYVT